MAWHCLVNAFLVKQELKWLQTLLEVQCRDVATCGAVSEAQNGGMLTQLLGIRGAPLRDISCVASSVDYAFAAAVVLGRCIQGRMLLCLFQHLVRRSDSWPG